jgi:hypothetical protein
MRRKAAPPANLAVRLALWGVAVVVGWLGAQESARADFGTFAQFKLDPDSTQNLANPFFLASGQNNPYLTGSDTNGSFFASRTDGSNTVGAIDVVFSFLNVTDPPNVPALDIKATLLITMSSTESASLQGLSVSQMFDSGHLEIISKDNPDVPLAGPYGHVVAGLNLLSVDFANVLLTGLKNGSSGVILGATDVSTITYSSDFLNFDNTAATDRDFSFSLSSITPKIALSASGSKSLFQSFTSSGTGTFDGDITSSVLPEPGSSVLVGLGIAAVAGFGLRRGRKAA